VRVNGRDISYEPTTGGKGKSEWRRLHALHAAVPLQMLLRGVTSFWDGPCQGWSGVPTSPHNMHHPNPCRVAGRRRQHPVPKQGFRRRVRLPAGPPPCLPPAPLHFRPPFSRTTILAVLPAPPTNRTSLPTPMPSIKPACTRCCRSLLHLAAKPPVLLACTALQVRVQRGADQGPHLLRLPDLRHDQHAGRQLQAPGLARQLLLRLQRWAPHALGGVGDGPGSCSARLELGLLWAGGRWAAHPALSPFIPSRDVACRAVPRVPHRQVRRGPVGRVLRVGRFRAETGSHQRLHPRLPGHLRPLLPRRLC
jgi:hypothetical protein